MKKINQNLFSRMLFLGAVLLSGLTQAQPNVRVDITAPVITGLTGAMQLAHAGDGSNRVFIAERRGVVKVFLASQPNTPITFLNMNQPDSIVSSNGEGGLLSIAFHPNFENNGYLYVYYTNRAGDLVIARYTASGNSVATNTRKEILLIPHPIQENHNGGELHFGADGFLYASIGDGGGANDGPNNAQNVAVLLGKILRLDVNVPDTASPAYAVPATNPFPNSIVYAIGLRNPFRWSFDRQTGDMWIGDVGQGAYEEINYRPAGTALGVNFGWRCFEANIETPGVSRTGCGDRSQYIFPRYAYPVNATRGRSVIGGVVYRGSRWPLMSGYYIGTDYFSGQIHKILPGSNYAEVQDSDLRGRNTTDIGENEAGEIYAVTSTSVYEIFGEEALPVTLISFDGMRHVEGVKLAWKTTMEESFSGFDVEFSTDARNFQVVGNIPGGNIATGAQYGFTHATTQSGNLYYRLKMIDVDQTFRYSKTITVQPEDVLAGGFVRPSLINTKNLRLVLESPFQSMELVSAAGQVLLREEITGRSGDIDIPLGETVSGIYFVRLADHDRIVQEKILIVD